MAPKVGRPSKLRFLTPSDTEQSTRLAGVGARRTQGKVGVYQGSNRHDEEPHFRHANETGHMAMVVFTRAEQRL
jgi:hypothetical protein